MAFVGVGLVSGARRCRSTNARTKVVVCAESDVKYLKKALLSTIGDLDEGRRALNDKELQENVEFYAKKLESLAVPEPVLSDAVSGSWKLVYTTSKTVLGANLPAFVQYLPGTNRQIIDAANAAGRNEVGVRVGGIFSVLNSISLELTIKPPKRAMVQFKKFKIGPVSFDAPASARGYIDVTYVDDELRVTRGNEGNLFVLVKE